MKKFPRLSPASWLTTKTVLSQLFGIVLFGVQAPLLGPRAFGLLSIVMIFIGFCESVPGEAAAESLISIREIDAAHYSSMTTTNVVIAAVFGVLVFLGAPQFARLFGDAELSSMLRWMAILPVVTAFGVVPTAATKRDMQFGPLALRSIGSLFVGGLVGLVLTLTGAGVWALVWQALVTRVVAVILLWYAVPIKFEFGFSRSHVADLAQYALPTMLSRAMSWVTSQLPRFILGLFWGPSELGLFSLAGRLSDILMEVAVVPRYAASRIEMRGFAADRNGLEGAINQRLRHMSLICFPLSIGGAVVIPTLFHAWLDARWFPGIVPAQLLLLMCLPAVTIYFVSALLLAFNAQKAEAVSSIAQTLVTIIVVMIAAPFGVIIASTAVAVRPYLLLPLSAYLARTRVHVSVRNMWQAQMPVLTAALVMGASVTGLQWALEPYLHSILLLIVEVTGGALIYVLLITALMPQFAKNVMNQVRARLPAALF